MIALVRFRDLDVVSNEDRPAGGFVSAASGLVRVGDFLHVVADDDLSLATFRLGDPDPGRLLPMLPGVLPPGPAERKKAKPDFEALVALPPMENHPHGALLAMGSGSRPNRRRGVLMELGRNGTPLATRPVDLSTLYRSCEDAFDELNIEGAVVRDDRLLMFQRGNAGNPLNAIVSLPLVDALAALDPGSSDRSPTPAIRIVDVGTMAGVPLAFTDAAIVDGMIVFSAVAEDTRNAYDDGPLAGAAVGIVDPTGAVLRLEAIDPPVKVEGIDAVRDGDLLRLTLVTDADDPAKPAGLFTATLPI